MNELRNVAYKLLFSGSVYRDPISMAILELQENGRIQMLYNKWWKNTGTCNHDDKKQENKANSLGVENVGGIFVVLFVGLALAVISAVAEFVWNSRRNASQGRVGAPVSNTYPTSHKLSSAFCSPQLMRDKASRISTSYKFFV